MHVKIIHHDRKWRRVNNHMDARHCPDCGATVHGSYGQSKHLEWHLELADLLESLSERAGVESRQEIPWTAAVDGDADPAELEAVQ